MTATGLRHGLAVLLVGVLAGLVPARANDAMRPITDIAGRTVEVPADPRRVVLADGFVISALNVLEPDPTARLVGWDGAFKTIDPASYALYRARFPAIENIAGLGNITAAGASLETIAALRPDLVVLPFDAAGNAQLLARFEAFGVPTVIVDFFADPARNTVPSLRVLGRLFGREARAEDFISFYERHIKRLAEQSPDGPHPKVLLQSHPGLWKCCWSPGRASLGAFVTLAGGLNIGAEPLPPQGGWLSREYVVAQAPDLYVATGRPGNDAQGGLSIGPGVGSAEARDSLAALAGASDLRILPAIRSGKIFGLWNFFLDTPANVIAAELLATWINPEAFKDVKPLETLAEFNAFAAVPMQGTYWTRLGGEPGAP